MGAITADAAVLLAILLRGEIVAVTAASEIGENLAATCCR